MQSDLRPWIYHGHLLQGWYSGLMDCLPFASANHPRTQIRPDHCLAFYGGLQDLPTQQRTTRSSQDPISTDLGSSDGFTRNNVEFGCPVLLMGTWGGWHEESDASLLKGQVFKSWDTGSIEPSVLKGGVCLQRAAIQVQPMAPEAPFKHSRKRLPFERMISWINTTGPASHSGLFQCTDGPRALLGRPSYSAPRQHAAPRWQTVPSSAMSTATGALRRTPASSHAFYPVPVPHHC
jgi:hypothetical protein